MSPQEFEQALHDAEVKLARLKALYEQWFQGIERVEPTVARKELDRTIDLLKKSVPRNTALRFRMQQLVARYGTYGIYWGRIARQIEEGTYKRDVIRVNKKKNPKNEKRAADQAWELDVEIDDIEEMDEEKTDPGIVVTGSTPHLPSAPPKNVSAAPRPGGGFDESDLDAILGALSPPTADESANKSRSARPLSPFAMGGARPAAGGASATFGKPKEKAVPAAVAPVAASPIAPPIAKPAPMATPSKPIVAPPMTMPTPLATPSKPIAPPALAPRPPPPAAPRPPAPTPAAAPRPAPAAPSSDLDERQMRAIYSKYVDARKQNNERADVRYEVLAESVKKMMPKLREKHAGKAIDFEIVLQNGKVGLKPKVGG